LRTAIERAIPHGMSPKTKGFRGRDEGSWNTPPAPVDAAWAQLKDEFDAICLKTPKLKNTNNYRHLGTLGSGSLNDRNSVAKLSKSAVAISSL
jgi:tRNA-splicing ligase RtcB